MNVRQLLEILRGLPLEAHVVLPTGQDPWEFRLAPTVLSAAGVRQIDGTIRINPFEETPLSYKVPVVIIS